MKRMIILISGRGSNMQAIIEACQRENWPAEISAVISNREEAEGLAIAKRYGIRTVVVASKAYPDRELFEEALKRAIHPFSPDLIVLAGFMRILTPAFVQEYAGRIINIHPSLLPKFTGLDTHQRVLDSGEVEHGATVHVVTAALDHGPILAQVRIPILPGDTKESLAKRLLLEEHCLYKRVVYDMVTGAIPLPYE